MTVVWNAQRVSEGLSKIDSARPGVLANIQRLLNQYHNEKNSARYYDILLGDWVERYLHLVYVATQDLASGAPLRRVYANDAKTFQIKPSNDTAEFFAQHQTLPQVMLDAIQVAQISGVDVIKVSNDEVVLKNSVSFGWRGRLSNAAFKLFSRSSSRVLFVKPFSGKVPTSWVSALFSWRKWATHDDLNIPYLVSTKVDGDWRGKNLVAVGSDAGLESLANSLVTAFLPVCAVESFKSLRELVSAARPKRFDHVYSAQALWTHFSFKLLVAQWCEKGTKLHYHQHGGWYGLDELHVGENYEARVADSYYTWGWTRDNANVRPLSPVMPQIQNQAKTHDSLICFDQPKHVYRLQYFPLPGTLQTMYNQTADFVRLRESKTPLKIRLFPGDYGSVQKDAIKNARYESNFDNSEDIFTQYSTSRIVIHNYLGTSWLETIGNNIPTVCFYDVDAYRFRSDAKRLLEDLVDAGVLHLSGESAALHVNEIENDVGAWWQRDDVQAARENFAKQFANFSTDWKLIWQKNFAN